MDLIKIVCIKEFNSFANNEVTIDKEDRQAGSSVPFMASGDLWKSSRALHTATITPNKIRSIYPLITKVSENMVEYLKGQENTPLEVKTLSTKYAIDILSSCVYGLKTNSFINFKNEFHLKAVKFFLAPKLYNIIFMILSFAPWISRYLEIKMPKKEIKYLTRIIKNSIENSPKNEDKEINFVQIMANVIAKDHSTKHTYEDLAHHSFTYFAAFNTIPTQLGFVLYMLALHPDVQRKLRQEIKETVDKELEVLEKMKYLDAVVYETLRIYPINLVVRRVCTQDIVLKSAGRQYPIKKGMSIAIPFYTLNRDETYFPEPMKFNPDRFYCKEMPPQFLPFGIGPRTCFGGRFGLAAIKSAIFHVVQHFEIIIKEDEVPKMPVLSVNSLLISSKETLWLKFNKLN
ncbi:probable cytochrome P450 6a23 [Rhodnius prolixus]|uniref:probable cytochrome P450 6a23 n=1 Tax=Rhodnius prolixus TaxID=13249 RepID=UPI003D18BF4A